MMFERRTLNLLVAMVAWAVPPDCALAQAAVPTLMADQYAVDLGFRPQVGAPVWTAEHPRLLIDEGHSNLYMASKLYRPFAQLVAADGWSVASSKHQFTDSLLASTKILVIGGARGGVADAMADPAFDGAEVSAIMRWIEAGGSLLLATGPGPLSAAIETLTQQLGVTVSARSVFDSVHFDAVRGRRGFLIATTDAGTLADHPIIRGRGPAERLHRIESFSGASLGGPVGATNLITFSTTAYELRALSKAARDSAVQMMKARLLSGSSSPMGGAPPQLVRPTGVAMATAFERGKGRVVVVGDASMLTALLLPVTDGPPTIGFGVANVDNQQFALNVVRWLGRLY